MEEQSVIHNTFVIERHYPASPERVFGAFSDPGKKRRWFVEGDHHDVEHYEMDFREGGFEHARFRLKGGTPLDGAALTNNTRYQNIVPNRRIVFASTMSVGDKCISASLGTLEFVAASTGTDLIFTHQAAFFEGADGPQMREGGRQKLLDKLKNEFISPA
jgi:uncharacterized protein YndB with AHSA1/START domain